MCTGTTVLTVWQFYGFQQQGPQDMALRA